MPALGSSVHRRGAGTSVLVSNPCPLAVPDLQAIAFGPQRGRIQPTGGRLMEPTEAFAGEEILERGYIRLAAMAEGGVRRLGHLEVESQAERACFARMT